MKNFWRFVFGGVLLFLIAAIIFPFFARSLARTNLVITNRANPTKSKSRSASSSICKIPTKFIRLPIPGGRLQFTFTPKPTKFCAARV